MEHACYDRRYTRPATDLAVAMHMATEEANAFLFNDFPFDTVALAAALSRLIAAAAANEPEAEEGCATTDCAFDAADYLMQLSVCRKRVDDRHPEWLTKFAAETLGGVLIYAPDPDPDNAWLYDYIRRLSRDIADLAKTID